MFDKFHWFYIGISSRNAANDGSDEVDSTALGRKRDIIRNNIDNEKNKVRGGFSKFPTDSNEENTILNECLNDLKSM